MNTRDSMDRSLSSASLSPNSDSLEKPFCCFRGYRGYCERFDHGCKRLEQLMILSVIMGFIISAYDCLLTAWLTSATTSKFLLASMILLHGSLNLNGFFVCFVLFFYKSTL